MTIREIFMNAFEESKEYIRWYRSKSQDFADSARIVGAEDVLASFRPVARFLETEMQSIPNAYVLLEKWIEHEEKGLNTSELFSDTKNFLECNCVAHSSARRA